MHRFSPHDFIVNSVYSSGKKFNTWLILIFHFIYGVRKVVMVLNSPHKNAEINAQHTRHKIDVSKIPKQIFSLTYNENVPNFQ